MKQRVTYFIDEDLAQAVRLWCKAQDPELSYSSAVEAALRKLIGRPKEKLKALEQRKRVWER